MSQAKYHKQPSPMQVQQVINLLQSGQLPQAEAAARKMVESFPGALIFYNVLGVAQEGQQKFAEAAKTYQQALKLDPGIAEMHFNLGSAYENLGRSGDAMACYRKALSLKPELDVAWFNLGYALQQQGQYGEAADCYRKATGLQPGFYEAHGNLGVVLQKQGKLEEAVESYLTALRIHPDPLGHFNLGTALRDQGKHEDAAQSYLRALEMHPNYADAHNNLGEIFRDQGNMDSAIKSYQTALGINPEHPGANYNMAEFLYLAKKYDEARPYFERSKYLDFEERALDCLYRIGQYDAFRQKLEALVVTGKKSTLLSMLSTHYATNFGVENVYDFCREPMDYAWHTSIPELAEADSPLLAELLEDITHTALAERKQGRLYYGIQSAGNLLKRPEPSFQKLAELVKGKIREYQARYAGSDCELIQSFPKEIEFSSSWYLKMNKGGHLTSHIHEEGWISGCVYLKLPSVRKDPTEAAFMYGTDGDDYPRRHDNFPSHIVVQQVGDIVLFPSSLFHRTIPFHSDEERVCVAFDLKPAA
jgi:uncharacterized protein (TIGR02466 family)